MDEKQPQSRNQSAEVEDLAIDADGDESASATLPTLDTDEPGRGIDLQYVGLELETAEEYVQETQAEFTESADEQMINALLETIQTAKRLVRDLEIQYADQLVPWKDADGEEHEILLEQQDAKNVAKAIELYDAAEEKFAQYVAKHLQKGTLAAK